VGRHARTRVPCENPSVVTLGRRGRNQDIDRSNRLSPVVEGPLDVERTAGLCGPEWILLQVRYDPPKPTAVLRPHATESHTDLEDGK